MALNIPTTAELTAQNIAYYESRLGQTVPINDQAFLRVLAAIEAGLASMHGRHIAERALQTLALTATGERLEKIGNNYGVLRKAAVAFSGTILQPAADGTVIPITVDYVSEVSGIRYAVDAASPPAAGGYATVSVAATTSGVAGNLFSGDELTIGHQVAGITSTTATYDSTVIAGVDREGQEAYRRRVLHEIRTVGGGGNAVDYRTWAEEVPGVARCFPFAGAPVFFAPQIATRKLRDGDMEIVDTSYWHAGNAATISKQTGTPHGGTRCMRIAYGGSTDPYAGQYSLEVGREYTLSGWARSSGFADPSVAHGTVIEWTGTSSTSWQSFAVTFIASDLDIRLIMDNNAAGYVEFDDVALFLHAEYPGDRVVYVESTTDVDPDGIPTQLLLDAVRESLNTDPVTGHDRMPLGLTDEKLFVEPIVRTAIDIEIEGLVVDPAKEVELKSSISDAFTEALLLLGPFVRGVDAETSKADTITGVMLADLIQEIMALQGASAEEISFSAAGGPAVARYQVRENELVKLGTVTYV